MGKGKHTSSVSLSSNWPSDYPDIFGVLRTSPAPTSVLFLVQLCSFRVPVDSTSRSGMALGIHDGGTREESHYLADDADDDPV